MRGGGTKLGITPNNEGPICLDLTRLLSRTGKVHTGVDRVEWAYLEWCLSLERPVFALVRSAFGYLLLDRAGMAYVHKRLQSADWGKTDLLSQFAFKLSKVRRAAETALRKQAIARATPYQLGKMLKQQFGGGVWYLNTGHSNLNRRVFHAFDALDAAQTAVLIHDLIPLDWPDHQRAGTVAAFEQRMRIVSRYADVLICNSQQTFNDCERHMSGFGRMPAAFVAHLGVELPKTFAEPPSIPKPYVITIGTIEPRKNHGFLLDLWEQWDEAPHLVICGNRGWKNEDVFARLDSVKLVDLRITELNGIEDAQMMGLLKGAKAALFPSLAEGFGLPQAEALGLGVPVICNDLDIYREILGEFPVYATTSDAYDWRTKIEGELHQDSKNQGRADKDQTQFTAPKWETHFNLVVKHLG